MAACLGLTAMAMTLAGQDGSFWVCNGAAVCLGRHTPFAAALTWTTTSFDEELMRRLSMKQSTLLPFVLSIFTSIAGCSHTSMMTLSADQTPSPDEQAYINKVKMFPLEFSVSNAEAIDAWHRAESFISRFSLMKHQTGRGYIIPTYFMKYQTGREYLIPTYNSSQLGVSFGYCVTMTPLKELVRFSVQCNAENVFKAANANINAHILAYYMETGDLPYPRLIKK